MHGWMDGARRQGSLRVSSSVAEGVLTPAALHLRVSAEVERRSEGDGGWGCGELGKRAKVSHFASGLATERPLARCKLAASQPTNRN